MDTTDGPGFSNRGRGRGGYQGGFNDRGGYNDYSGGRGGGGYGGGFNNTYHRGGGRSGGRYNQDGFSQNYRGGRSYQAGGRGDGYGGNQAPYDTGRGGRRGGYQSGGRAQTWGRDGGSRDRRQGRDDLASEEPQILPSNMTLFCTIPAHEKAVTAMAYDQGANDLYTGSKDGFVKRWNLVSQQCLTNVQIGGEVHSVLVSGGYLFVGFTKGRDREAEGIIRLWNMGTGVEQMLTGHRGIINQIMAANSLLFTCGQDHSIRVWALEPTAGLFTSKGFLTKDDGGHTSSVFAMECYGSFLFSGDQSGALKVWDLGTLKVVQSLNQAHAGPILRILQYEGHILTCSADGTVKVWLLQPTPALGSVISPDVKYTYPSTDEDESRYRRTRAQPSAILTMEGTMDSAGCPVLLVSRADDGHVKVLKLPDFSCLGVLPDVPTCRCLASAPGVGVMSGDDRGRAKVFQWAPVPMAVQGM